MMGTKVSND